MIMGIWRKLDEMVFLLVLVPSLSCIVVMRSGGVYCGFRRFGDVDGYDFLSKPNYSY
jgi:hypothetical protein